MALVAVIGVLIFVLLVAGLAGRRARAKQAEQAAEAEAKAAREATEATREALLELGARPLEDAPVDAAETRAAAPAVRRERFQEELAASLDLADVANRVLDLATAVNGVDAAIVDAAAVGDERHLVATGMPPEEIPRAAAGIPDHDNLRAVEISYRYRLDDVRGQSSAIRSGIALPLRAGGTWVGTLSVFTRSSARRLGDQELDELEHIAFRAGPALENARRFAEARVLADMDALTRLHNRRYFHETLAREVARAQRYRRRLALIVCDLDDFKAVNDRIGHLAGDAVLAEIAARTLTVVRAADVACRVGGDEFGIVLPESGREDAALLSERLARSISTRAIGRAGKVYLSAGVAELREGDDAASLFERADEALYRAKEQGKAQTVAAEGA